APAPRPAARGASPPDRRRVGVPRWEAGRVTTLLIRFEADLEPAMYRPAMPLWPRAQRPMPLSDNDDLPDDSSKRLSTSHPSLTVRPAAACSLRCPPARPRAWAVTPEP